MMRSLWSAASGMKAQQTNMDVVAHNIANVNTYGNKKVRAEFQDLLYQTLRRHVRQRHAISSRLANRFGRPSRGNEQSFHARTIADDRSSC